MTNIAIFASGSGTNAERIVRYFEGHKSIRVSLVLSNNSKAYVLERANKLGIDSVVVSKNDFNNRDHLLSVLNSYKVDFIVLAGFLLLVPDFLIKAYPNRIVNIHPALLPGYGGKGMYGSNVHRAVLKNGEKESGISIHYVNENYDEGELIFQSRFPIEEGESLESLEQKIHHEEYTHYPPVIEKTINLIFS